MIIHVESSVNTLHSEQKYLNYAWVLIRNFCDIPKRYLG